MQATETPGAIHPHPAFFDGPQAWTARDFSGPSDWLLSFTEETKQELKSAVAHARQRHADAGMLQREDFPLPSFASMAAQIRKHLREGRGFVVLRGLALDGYTD